MPRPGSKSPAAADEAPAQTRLGAVISAVRTEKGLTLAQVSARTGLPVSTLSKIENDKSSPTYDRLVRIAAAIDLDLAMLFAQGPVGPNGQNLSGRRWIMRAGEGHKINTGDYTYLYLAAELLQKRFVPIVADVRARSLADFGEPIRHVGEEFVYVLEGAIEFHTELYAPVLLKKGDSAYFDSGMGHAYIAKASGPCRVLSICSATETQLIDATTHKTSPPARKKAAKTRPQRRK